MTHAERMTYLVQKRAANLLQQSVLAGEVSLKSGPVDRNAIGHDQAVARVALTDWKRLRTGRTTRRPEARPCRRGHSDPACPPQRRPRFRAFPEALREENRLIPLRALRNHPWSALRSLFFLDLASRYRVWKPAVDGSGVGGPADKAGRGREEL